MPKYLEPIQLDGLVVRESLEQLFSAPNHGSCLGTLAISETRLIRPSLVPLKIWPTDGHALFEVQAIHRRLIETNSVTSTQQNITSHANHERHDHIAAIGILQQVALEQIVIGEGCLVDYGSATLSVLGPEYEAVMWPIVVELPRWQNTEDIV